MKNIITKYLNSIYMVISFFIWFLIYKSYKKNAKMSMTVYPAYIILVIRVVLRMADFDNLKARMEPSFWYDSGLYHTCTYTFYMTVFMFSFYNLKGSYVIYIFILTIATGVCRNNYNPEVPT